jgi:hypothetical protein
LGSPRKPLVSVGYKGGLPPLRDDHADRLITELMDRVDRLEAELACYWLADARDRGVA